MASGIVPVGDSRAARDAAAAIGKATRAVLKARKHAEAAHDKVAALMLDAKTETDALVISAAFATLADDAFRASYGARNALATIATQDWLTR